MSSAENRYKATARTKLNRALASGLIERKACEWLECSEVLTEAHHPDYTEPLEVLWLCRSHHMDLHGAIGVIPLPEGTKSASVGKPRIQDEFTDRPVSRQRKWAMRNPDKQKALVKRHRQNKAKKKEKS